MDVENYSSGDDIVVEFLRLRFSFNAADFAQRVSAAAYRLGLVDDNELDEEETEDLVELTADGLIEEPRSELGRYLVRHWERLSLVDGESLVYWLEAGLPRRLARPPRQGGPPRGELGRRGGRVRLPRPARRAGAAGARAGPFLARAAVQAALGPFATSRRFARVRPSS